MINRDMNPIRYGRTFLSILAAITTAIVLPTLLNAQPIDTIGPQRIADEELRREATSLVESFFTFGYDQAGMDADSIENYAIDQFADYLQRMAGTPFWPNPYRYDIGEVYSIRPELEVVMVTSRTYPGAVPLYGELAVDWIWFLRRDKEKGWRISSLRRTKGIPKAMEKLAYVDTTGDFPASLKPTIAREWGAILLDNEAIRAEFKANRPLLQSLVDRLSANDSIVMLERMGDHISQFNNIYVDWGMAAQELPQEVIDEYLATASPEVAEQIAASIRHAERQRRQASDTLGTLAGRVGVSITTLDEIAAMMKQGRIRFINSDLPMRDAMLLTIDGELDDAVGLLYSPHGELPYISPEEFFYLEDLGDGWWIFRSV